MPTLYLCGAGNSEGVRLAQTLNRQHGRWDRIELLDDDRTKLGTEKLGVRVTGTLDALDEVDPSSCEAVNLVARTTAGRRAVSARIRAAGIPFARMVAGDVDLAGTSVAPDVIIYQHATIGPEVTIGEGAVIFMGAVVGHESTVAEHCIIASNAVLNARVVLETGTYVGSCATIVPEVNVGAHATIGAGSLVIQDVPAGATAVGVPAELVKFSPMRVRCDDEPVPIATVLDQSGIEQALLDVWRDVLGLASIERDQNFFDLGGRSLQVLRVRERLRQRTGRELPITDFFRFPSIRQLAEHVSLVATNEGSPLARAWARRVAVRRTFHAGGAM